MSAQPCIQTVPPLAGAGASSERAPRPVMPPLNEPALPSVEPVAVSAAMADADVRHAPTGGVVVRLRQAYRRWRADRILRNLADEMDAHMLKDVGAPDWLVSQALVEQSLKRINRIDSLRW